MDDLLFENNSTPKKNIFLKSGFAIKILSVLALVCTALSCLTYFFGYDYEFINDEYVRKLTFQFPDFISLISFLLSLAPSVLFVLYIFKFHNKLKATILVPIIFGLLAATPLWGIIRSLIHYSMSVNYYDLSGDDFWLLYGLDFITNLIPIITFSLATISALKGLSNKIFIIIPISVSLIYDFLSLLLTVSNNNFYLEEGMQFYLFTSAISLVASVILNIALLLFSLKNRIPAILSMSPEKEKAEAEKMTPEQSLRLLKDKLDLGMISEEEYQAKRAEIISKL